MTPEIVSEIKTRMGQMNYTLTEIHNWALAAGSSWSEDQVALLLGCLVDIKFTDGTYKAESPEKRDPLLEALLQLVDEVPIPATVLVRQLPRGIIVTPAALCEKARRNPLFEVVGANRIRRRHQ